MKDDQNDMEATEEQIGQQKKGNHFKQDSNEKNGNASQKLSSVIKDVTAQKDIAKREEKEQPHD